MSDRAAILEAYAAIERGDVKTAVPASASLVPATEGDGVLLELIRAMVSTHTGFPADAGRTACKALARARALGDEDLELRALLALAQALAHERSEADVAALLERAAQLAARQPLALARARVRQAALEITLRDMDRAEGRLTEAKALFEEAGRADLAVDVQIQQANARLRQGRFEEADAVLDEAAPHVPANSSTAGAYHTLRAQHAWFVGDLDRAVQELARAHEVYSALGLLPQQVDCTVNRAEVLPKAGRSEEARELYLRLTALELAQDATFFAHLNLAVVSWSSARSTLPPPAPRPWWRATLTRAGWTRCCTCSPSPGSKKGQPGPRSRAPALCCWTARWSTSPTWRWSPGGSASTSPAPGPSSWPPPAWASPSTSCCAPRPTPRRWRPYGSASTRCDGRVPVPASAPCASTPSSAAAGWAPCGGPAAKAARSP